VSPWMQPDGSTTRGASHTAPRAAAFLAFRFFLSGSWPLSFAAASDSDFAYEILCNEQALCHAHARLQGHALRVHTNSCKQLLPSVLKAMLRSCVHVSVHASVTMCLDEGPSGDSMQQPSKVILMLRNTLKE
jgi:hypothetical protein